MGIVTIITLPQRVFLQCGSRRIGEMKTIDFPLHPVSKTIIDNAVKTTCLLGGKHFQNKTYTFQAVLFPIRATSLLSLLCSFLFYGGVG